MTDGRKQELRQLLQEAMNNLVIRVRFENGTIPKEKYIETLRKRCEFYGISDDRLNNYYYLLYQPDISKEETKADLLEFIRRELNPVIEDDKIGYTTYNVDGCAQDGFCLVKRSNTQTHNLSNTSDVLEYVLKMSLAFGVDQAVLTFDADSCLGGNLRYYQSITSLEGITIETKIQICRGIRLVPIPRDIAFQLNDNLQKHHHRQRDKGTTLLIIERPMLSVFHKPSETIFDENQPVNLPFQVEANEIELSNQRMIIDFRETFCQALSLACNTMVMFDYFWDYSAADVFRSDEVERKIWYLGPIGKSVEAGQSEIEEAIRLYKILEIFDKKLVGQYNKRTEGIFWIASERWRRSKTPQTPEDKMIDLGIAFESLYVPAKVPGKRRNISANLKNNASRYLGKDKTSQETLKKKFKIIYECRCDAVHEGKLDQEAEVEGNTISMSEFIAEAQNLCRDSIMKILEDGEFPDWNNLILGEVDN